MLKLLTSILIFIISFSVHSEEVVYTKDGRMGTKCFPYHPDSSQEICRVSVTQLAVTPEKYHGKMVRVKAKLLMRHEVTGLKYGEHKIWIEAEDYAPYLYMDSQYVQVEGIFNAFNSGHYGMWDGAIENPVEIKPSFSVNDE